MNLTHQDIQQMLLINLKEDPELKQYLTGGVYICHLPPWITAKFRSHQVPGDGDCLFHSLGAALGKTASIVRREICNYMYTNQATFFNKESVILAISDMERGIPRYPIDYIKYMRTEKTSWGTQIEIYAAMLLYGRPIHVYHPNTQIHHNQPMAFIENFIRDNNIRSLPADEINIFNCSSDSTHTVNVGHYELLIPLGRLAATGQAAAAERSIGATERASVATGIAAAATGRAATATGRPYIDEEERRRRQAGIERTRSGVAQVRGTSHADAGPMQASYVASTGPRPAATEALYGPRHAAISAQSAIYDYGPVFNYVPDSDPKSNALYRPKSALSSGPMPAANSVPMPVANYVPILPSRPPPRPPPSSISGSSTGPSAGSRPMRSYAPVVEEDMDRAAEKREADKRAAEKREADRRAAEKREAERIKADSYRRAEYKREADRIEADKREKAGKKEVERIMEYVDIIKKIYLLSPTIISQIDRLTHTILTQNIYRTVDSFIEELEKKVALFPSFEQSLNILAIKNFITTIHHTYPFLSDKVYEQMHKIRERILLSREPMDLCSFINELRRKGIYNFPDPK